jgi:hypothetical protein
MTAITDYWLLSGCHRDAGSISAQGLTRMSTTRAILESGFVAGSLGRAPFSAPRSQIVSVSPLSV